MRLSCPTNSASVAGRPGYPAALHQYTHGLTIHSVKGGCRRQVDDTAGLLSAAEMPCAPRQLRLVP
jgi:hypothetical protein